MRGSLRRDGMLAHPLLLSGFPKEESRRFQVWKIRFPPLARSLPMLGRGTTSASFPYYVIGKGKVDLYWSLGGAI